jgi:hypothetical protein
MRPWQLGNTTVRSPFRLREGLIALDQSSLQGNLRGRDQDIAFRQLLGENEVVSLGTDKTNSVGRKWRSALGKMGFLTPDLRRVKGADQSWIGPSDFITENGRRLIDADSVAAWQECFLRALAAYYIPSILEPKYAKDYAVFSPLRHVLNIMLELERVTGGSRLNFIEMALIVQLTGSANNVANVVEQVLELRTARENNPHKRRFDTEAYNAAAKKHRKIDRTFKDYADLNLRYLKATGLVLTKGKGITLAPEKHMLIVELAKDTSVPLNAQVHLATLCQGAKLPTDKKEPALEVLKDLLSQLSQRGKTFDLKGRPLDTPQNIAVVRHDVEEVLARINETDFAKRQVSEWEEIAALINLLATGKYSATFNGEKIVIPKDEAPAYFEWIIWRAFLAINKLINPPYEARRFKVDQDFLPVSTGRGGGSDLSFEFDTFVLGVEVTLTENARQEALEGESVRRHIAQLVKQYDTKPVYGLFSATKIDTNTVETFRSCNYYLDDVKMRVNVVPLTIHQFYDFFVTLFKHGKVDNAHVKTLLEHCIEGCDTLEALEWKKTIGECVNEHIQALGH